MQRTLRTHDDEYPIDELHGLVFSKGPQACADKKAKVGVLDTKTLKKYWLYASTTYKE